MAKVDCLKRAVGKEHELYKPAVAQGEAKRKKAKHEVAKLKQQVKSLMAQLQQRNGGERHKLGPLDTNVTGTGAEAGALGRQNHEMSRWATYRTTLVDSLTMIAPAAVGDSKLRRCTEPCYAAIVYVSSCDGDAILTATKCLYNFLSQF